MKTFCIICLLGLFVLIGEVMSVVKCIHSDWLPPYKREIIYGAAALTGLGGIVGYFNIQDNKPDNIQ